MKCRLIAVVYDDQCNLCQALVRWLQRLDRYQRLMYVPIDPALSPKIHPELTAEACRRGMHVVTSDGQIFVGWDGVMYLARLFPLTWLIGVLGNVAPLRWLGRRFYQFIACHRSSLAKCRFF